MYRVIEMYGDYEPWWFIEGWEEDVIMSQSFDKYYDALKYYKLCWFEKIHGHFAGPELSLDRFL